MSAVIRHDGAPAQGYAPIADDAEIPAQGAVSVSLARWQNDAARLAQRSQPYAVVLPNTVDVNGLDSALLDAPALILQFPGFGDGRAYSQARLLRESRGYRGELRATGAAVVRDQLLGMIRCGIDSFELRADQSPDTFVQALREFSLAYQPALDPLPNVRALRRQRAG